MKKRTVIGILCIILATVLIFLVSPLVNQATTGLTDVVVLTENVQRGAEITEDILAVIQVNRDAIPAGAYTSLKDAEGYTKTALYRGDFLTEEKITATSVAAEDVLASLNGDQVAISFPISSFAAGLSGKLMNGDVISLIVQTEDGSSTIPNELQYVRVITTTTGKGTDQDQALEEKDGAVELPTTITVLATPEQAQMIAMYMKYTSIHVALVCRGDSPEAEELLNLQDRYLRKGEGELYG